MVRATKIGSVVVGLAASGLAWGQSALTPPSSVAEPAGKIITVNEPGKPVQKCRLVKMWTQPNGGKACQVQAIGSGEMMTIVQSAPATGGSKTLAMTIYHWTGSTPHPEAPLPPLTVETPPVVKTSAAFVQEAAPMPTAAPMPKAPLAVTMPANVSSVYMPQHGPAATGASMPTAPQRAPGPMTPGGVVLTPASSAHDSGSSSSCGDCGACGDCGTCCRPSLLERLKGCFKRDCSTTCCPDACTTCTPASAVPAKTAAGETMGTVPTATTPVPSKEMPTKPVTGLFQRTKPVDVHASATPRTELLDGTPHADDQKADPLKNPAAYGKTTAELAGAAAPKTDAPKPIALRADQPKLIAMQAEQPKSIAPQVDQPKLIAVQAGQPKSIAPQVDQPKSIAVQTDQPKSIAVQVETPKSAAPMMGKGGIPLGAASVVAAGGDVQYLPVPMETVQDARSPMPLAQAPEAPQPNQHLLANAFRRAGMAPAPQAMVGVMPGNAFGPSVPAEMMAQGSFIQAMPNAGNHGAPGFGPPGYGGTAYGQPLPAMPMGPAVQPGFYGPQRGQMVAPAGYYPTPPNPFIQQPMTMPVNPTGGIDVQSLLRQLRDSMLPSQREWAADKLAELDARRSPQVVDALVQAAKDDPAASVRAGCVHCLAMMSAATPPVIAAIQALKTDADPRVQHEAVEALAKLAPGQAPATMSDPAVQPAGGLLISPPRSN